MDSAPEIALTIDAWVRQFTARVGGGVIPPTPILREVGAPADPAVTVAALAALAAEALARDCTLWIVTADDSLLPDISNALDLRLRPLCLVLPGANYAGRIALRATLSLLKSRLARAAEDSAGPAWAAMRAHLQSEAALWRACLAWGTRGLDSEAPPAAIGTLFPVRIGPWTIAERLAAPADWVMLVQPGQLPSGMRTAWPGARCTLMLAATPVHGNTGLTIIDPTTRLRAELEVLGQELAEMELELATAQGELAAFTEHYHSLIAGRMSELDRVQADLAKILLESTPDDPVLDDAARQAEARAEQSRRERETYKSRETIGEKSFTPDNDLKKRFRQLAQKIHPDRATGEADRAWRTQLMSEANRAYRANDANALDDVFALWLAGASGNQGIHPAPASAVPPAPTSANTTLLGNEIARIRQRIAKIAVELDRLYGSKMYELFAAARVATRNGRDLLREMADRLDSQINQTLRKIDALN